MPTNQYCNLLHILLRPDILLKTGTDTHYYGKPALILASKHIKLGGNATAAGKKQEISSSTPRNKKDKPKKEPPSR